MIENRCKFQDVKGDWWTIVLTPEKIEKVKQLHGIDLLGGAVSNLIGPDRSIWLQSRIMLIVIEDTLKMRGLNEFTAADRFDLIEPLRAMEALAWAVIDYEDYTPEGYELMRGPLEDFIAASRRLEKVRGL